MARELRHYPVPHPERQAVARALLDAADDPIHDVRTSDSGFYVPDGLWDRAFPKEEAGDSGEPPAKPAKPASGQRRRS